MERAKVRARKKNEMYQMGKRRVAVDVATAIARKTRKTIKAQRIDEATRSYTARKAS